MRATDADHSQQESRSLYASRPGWSDLPVPAQAFRIAHAAWALVSLICLGAVWLSAITGRRGRRLSASMVWLGLEGLALVKGRGDCPFGPLQARLGDPVPLFELALPPRAARAAVPTLAMISAVGIGLVGLRMCRDRPAEHMI